MVGIIRRREQIKVPEPSFDPLIYFDANDTCTEADFITILENECYDSRLIGKYVTIEDVVNGGSYTRKYMIADVNHDSANTGQTNCYDLISVSSIDMNYYGKYNWPNNSISSYNDSVRYKLNAWYYNMLSNNLKSHMLNIKYKVNDYWYNEDKIIVPSIREIFGENYYSAKAEGIQYPIFANNIGNIKGNLSTWTRTYYLSSDYSELYVYWLSSGYVYQSTSPSETNVSYVALIRVS